MIRNRILAASAIVIIVISAIISRNFVFKTLPITTKSMEPSLGYNTKATLNKFTKKPRRNDIIAFHFPEGDTIIPAKSDLNYYTMNTIYGAAWISEKDLQYKPLADAEVLISRCIGLPGEILIIDNGQIYINKKKVKQPYPTKTPYFIVIEGLINPVLLGSIGIDSIDQSLERKFNPEWLKYTDIARNLRSNTVLYALDDNSVSKIRNFTIVKGVYPLIKPKNISEPYIFPRNSNFKWNEDNFGPILIPAKGKSLKLSLAILPIYKRIIEVYENNKLQINNDKIFINNQLTEYYTFKQNYYLVFNDNRYAKSDSRYWGFVPQNLIIGTIYN